MAFSWNNELFSLLRSSGPFRWHSHGIMSFFPYCSFDLYAPPREKNILNLLKGLRYEIVVDKIYELFDQNYKFMDYFELVTEPNLIHYFLAFALINHQYVITTNFDYLIEYAYKRLMPSERYNDLIPVISRKDFAEFKDPYTLTIQDKYCSLLVNLMKGLKKMQNR